VHQAAEAWEFHKAMREHGAKVQERRDLYDERYRLMRKLEIPNATVPVWGTGFHYRDGVLFRNDGRPVQRY
jgi:hypothetical protein